ncbi:SDR family oxidoreductase [Chrysiogenes arsenatis]|uniref:SDR family oxidoreductase n=1 Tax=Chrysiogenes arsenatis TaxID=309797 RepID=UPI00041CB4DC|nr:SDR family oxidoreductase [Chrysiogenes arsenatis]
MHILLTGANGYIGRRLKQALLSVPDISLRLMVRNAKSLDLTTTQRCEIAEATTFDAVALRHALSGIDIAYYLIHSLAAGAEYREKDKTSARLFLEAAINAGVKRIIYLGGLGDKAHASEHLLSRIETGEVLSSRPDQIQTLWIRAGVIIGSGSASFEIIRNLTQKLPIMITPRWVETMAQPIGVDDVVRYLVNSATLEVSGNQMIDIGADAMTYRELMLRTASVMGLKRKIIPVPVMTPTLSSYWLIFFTSVPYVVARELIEGLSSPVIVQNSRAKELFSFQPMSYEASVRRALDEIESRQVVSRWSDSGGEIWEKHRQGDIANALLIDRRRAPLNGATAAAVYRSFTMLGGDSGWFSYDWLWGMRGFIDKLLGGFGRNRGRRDACDLRIGDCLDFWKVVELEPDRRLLLFAQMKLPGKAWLEFMIDGDELIQTAYFYPDGIAGRLYWYAMLPAHFFVFRDLITKVLSRARTETIPHKPEK